MRQTSRSRKTKQRDVILEQLCSLTSHPSADELYTMVRRRLPRISMGTVYRNLELLASDGVIQKIEISGTQRRFDGNASDHYHVRCLDCGRVADAHIKTPIPIQDVVKEVTDFEIVGHRLELIGLCQHCRSRDRGPRNKSRMSKRNSRREPCGEHS